MKFQKSCLALAVSAAMFAGAANAVIDISAAPPTAASFASELNTNAAIDVANAGALTVAVDLGFSIAAATSKYIRFDLGNAVFKAALTGGADGVGDFADDNANADTYSISSGGGAGDSFVILEVGAVVGPLTSDSVLTFTIPAAGLTLADGTGSTIAYELHETAAGAVNQTVATRLSSVSATGIIDFVAAHSATRADATTNTAIDVANSSLTFAGDLAYNSIGQVAIADTVGSQFVLDGATDYSVDTAAHVASAALVITGDFTAAQDLTAGAPDGTYTLTKVRIDADGNCATVDGTNATAITDTTVTFALAGTGVSLAASDICVITNGVSSIDEANFSAVFTPANASATYDAVATSLTLDGWAKNGSSDRLTFALTPNGAYSNFVRITNPSSVAGDVFLTITDDAGVTSAINLSDVAGQSASLAAGASTSLIDINDIAAATTGLDLTDKLRVNVSAEFGATGALTGVNIQAFSMSQDGNSFFMLNKD